MFPPCSAQFRIVYPTGTSNRSVYPVIRRIVESGCNDFVARFIMARFTNRIDGPMGTLSSPQRCPSARGSVSFFRSNRANETAGFHRDDERRSGCRESACSLPRAGLSQDSEREGLHREMHRDFAARKGESVTSGGRSPIRVAFFGKRRQTREEPDKCPPAPGARGCAQSLLTRSRALRV